MTKAGMGISPISSISYIFTFFTPATLGMLQFFWNFILIVVQIILLRRAFQKIQMLQFGVSLLFSVFIDILMPFTAFLSMENQGYAYKSAVFAASLVIQGIQIGTVIAALLLGHTARFIIRIFTPVYKQLAGIVAL
jgi:uncharacterized membrane protein YczE